MYSLYRAWLLRESSPPDVVVCVGSATGRGSHQFSGHRTVLSSHSGYLKSLLGEPSANDAAHAQILVPNVSPEVFAPLLTFMYTGFLDLTPENIYGVLLATHLLHMPRALDLCRSYLLQQQQQQQVPPPPPPPLVVKPIASRKMLPVLLPPPAGAGHGVYWPPPPYHPLPPPLSDDPAGYRSVFPLALSKPETQVSSTATTAATTTASSSLSVSPLALPSTSDGRPGSAGPCHRRSGPSPTPSQTSDSSDRVTVTVAHRSKSKRAHGRSTGDAKVIVDVACCDGPVRFHRVLNRNYGVAATRKEPPRKNRNRNVAENENGSTADASEDASGPVFTCRFCNHTFKSHYCYQKHARRHINPVEPDLTSPPSTASSSTEDNPQQQTDTASAAAAAAASAAAVAASVAAVAAAAAQRQKEPTPPTPQQREHNHAHKREVRLLDMNVQYYPCKTCGSKFPSYYFVHKHRKMCHPGDDSATPNSQENNSSTD